MATTDIIKHIRRNRQIFRFKSSNFYRYEQNEGPDARSEPSCVIDGY